MKKAGKAKGMQGRFGIVMNQVTYPPTSVVTPDLSHTELQ